MINFEYLLKHLLIDRSRQLHTHHTPRRQPNEIRLPRLLHRRRTAARRHTLCLHPSHILPSINHLYLAILPEDHAERLASILIVDVRIGDLVLGHVVAGLGGFLGVACGLAGAVVDELGLGHVEFIQQGILGYWDIILRGPRACSHGLIQS